MSRYCELKLIDVLKPEMSAKKNKTVTDLKNFSSKTKLGNLSLLKSKTEILSDGKHNKDDSEPRETRLIKKSNNPTKIKTLSQDLYIYPEDKRKLNESKFDNTTVKRKRVDSKFESVEELSIKKVCVSGSSHLVPVSSRNVSSNPDQKITQSRKRKRKSRESFWENKLTGARRVSKRLSNLRIEKKKSLKNLTHPIDASQVSDEPKQPVHFSGRSKIKANEDLYRKSCKKDKSSYNRNRSEVQINFGKLSHTKRLYPKIAAGRRPATYTVTIKPAGSIQRNSRKRNNRNETFSEISVDENSSDPNIHSLINKSVEDIEDVIFSETENTLVSNCDIIQDNKKNKSNDESHTCDTPKQNNLKEITQENEAQTLVCNNDDEEFGDGIVIIDIESSEVETSKENQGNEQDLEFEKIDQERRKSENLTTLENLPEFVLENTNKPAKSEEKAEDDKRNNFNSDMIEVILKPEIKEQESTTAASSSDGPPTTQTIDITNTAD